MSTSENQLETSSTEGIIYPVFNYDSSVFRQVDNKPFQTNGINRVDNTIIFYGTKSCCFWPVNNTVLNTYWIDNVTSITLGNISGNIYYSGNGQNIIPVTGFIGIAPNGINEKFYNFSGALNIDNGQVKLDVEAIMGPENYAYLDGNITRICFMYPTVSIINSLD